MKKRILLLIILCIISACGGFTGEIITTPGSGGSSQVYVPFNKVELIYDLGLKFDTTWLDNDLTDFACYHGVSRARDTIKSLLDIMECVYDIPEEARRPSIDVTLHCRDSIFKKTYKKPDDGVGHYSLDNLPYTEDFIATGIIVIKSAKTSTPNGIQVRWEKSASYPNWPIQELVVTATKDGITGNAPGVTKGGTNNGNDDVATRYGGIIPNTYGDEGDCLDPIGDLPTATLDPRRLEYEGVCVDDPFYSPTLCRPIYSGGAFNADLEWEKPIIVKLSQL